MRNFNLFSLIIMLVAAFYTFQAIAAPIPAQSLIQDPSGSTFKKVHLVENLSPEASKHMIKILSEKGYEISLKPLFTESQSTLLVTQTLANEKEEASIEVEMMKLGHGQKLPRTIFKYQLKTNNTEEALNALPRPEEILEADTITPEELKNKPMFTQQLE